MMPQPTPPRDHQADNVVNAAVKWALSDFIALLLAYGRNGPVSDDIIVHIREQVTVTLKNASVTGMPLELQAAALSRALDDLAGFIDSAIDRGWKAHAPGR